ncbi:MAG: hypothetical protein UR12_C0048G0001 [candidate division TM6 bacterium GW2011_GWF2_30_66]|jgi:uncharacterized protein (DUF2252 family)|nr:MAG: hypothetical protein UR12_C0048G0001 [candidate division TM6 bacterium GW2011_GWF2_30_66]
MFSIIISPAIYYNQAQAYLFKFTKSLVFSTGVATISYLTLKAIAESEKNNSNKNGIANTLIKKIDTNAYKAGQVIKETTANCKSSINKNFNTNIDDKIRKIKNETKTFFQKSYSWIGYKLGFKDQE